MRLTVKRQANRARIVDFPDKQVHVADSGIRRRRSSYDETNTRNIGGTLADMDAHQGKRCRVPARSEDVESFERK